MLRRPGRALSLKEVALKTMRMRNVDDERLRHIFLHLLDGDPRFEVADDEVRMVEDPRERVRLKDLDFVVVDTETTGCSAYSRVIEIGAVRIRDGNIERRFETLLNPGVAIPPMISHLTGICRNSIHGQPKFEEIVPGFLQFVGDAVLVAHNASFDKNMLNAEFSRAYGRRLMNPYLCTVRLGRMFAPGLPSYRLDVLAAHFHILITNRHRAMGDAEATAEVLVRLLENAGTATLSEIRKTRIKRTARAASLSC